MKVEVGTLKSILNESKKFHLNLNEKYSEKLIAHIKPELKDLEEISDLFSEHDQNLIFNLDFEDTFEMMLDSRKYCLSFFKRPDTISESYACHLYFKFTESGIVLNYYVGDENIDFYISNKTNKTTREQTVYEHLSNLFLRLMGKYKFYREWISDSDLLKISETINSKQLALAQEMYISLYNENNK